MAADFGYTGKILRVDLSSGKTATVATGEYADRFLGGRGIAAKIYWDEVSPQVKALDPENRLIFATGPMAGFPAIGGSRWQICGKSPLAITEHCNYANLGGSWGVHLKFAGYDALVIEGKSDKPVYLKISDGTALIEDASALWGKGSREAHQSLKEQLRSSFRIVTIGPAEENMVSMATLLADNDACGSGGLGAVMGSKKLKAIAVRGSGRVIAASPEKLSELIRRFRKLREGADDVSTHSLVGPRLKSDVCYGCIGGCMRAVYQAETGGKGKFMCQAATFYDELAHKYYGRGTEVPFYATKLCDEYGMSTKSLSPMIEWLSRCYKAGILTEENTGIPLSKVGSFEFIETLVRKISFQEGLGNILAQGTLRAAEALGQGAKELLGDNIYKSGEPSTYCPRLYITTGLLYATEPAKQPIQQLHEIDMLLRKWVKWAEGEKDAYLSSDVVRAIAQKFWGSEIAADFSTYEGKALAAKKIQDRQYAKECLILCDFLWPLTSVASSEDHLGDSTLESQILSAITGKNIDEEGLYTIGERVFNLQRAIFVREGHKGRQSDFLMDFCYSVPLGTQRANPECLVPGKAGEVISRKGAVVDREKFEALKDKYYQFRGWDIASGLQTRAKLAKLGLEDIADSLAQSRLAA